MFARRARLLLIALTVLGLLLPRISAAVAMVTPGVQAVVICSGSGLKTLYIDADGNPLPADAGAHDDHCLLVHAADTAIRIAPIPAVASWTIAPRREVDPAPVCDAQAARPPPRAPPGA